MPHKLPEDRDAYHREWRQRERHREQQRRYRAKNREYFRLRAKAWRERNKHVCKLARVYGLSVEEARELFNIPREEASR